MLKEMKSQLTVLNPCVLSYPACYKEVILLKKLENEKLT